MWIVQSDSNRDHCPFVYVGTARGGWDWVERPELAERFATRKDAEKALLTLGWTRAMGDAVQFISDPHAGCPHQVPPVHRRLHESGLPAPISRGIAVYK